MRLCCSYAFSMALDCSFKWVLPVDMRNAGLGQRGALLVSEKKAGGNQCGMMSSLRLRLCAVCVFAKLGLIRIGLSNECGRKD